VLRLRGRVCEVRLRRLPSADDGDREVDESYAQASPGRFAAGCQPGFNAKVMLNSHSDSTLQSLEIGVEMPNWVAPIEEANFRDSLTSSNESAEFCVDGLEHQA